MHQEPPRNISNARFASGGETSTAKAESRRIYSWNTNRMSDLPTTERLARDLANAGLPDDMVKRAREGWYDDFVGPNAMPITLLVQDLRDNNRPDLAAEAANGKWDATKEEGEAWAASSEGQATHAEFLGNVTPMRPWGKDAETTTAKGAADMADKLPTKNPGMLFAAIDALKRSRAKNIHVGIDEKNKWWAEADVMVSVPHVEPGYVEQMTAHVDSFSSPEYAAEALARRVLDGGECQHCHKTVRLAGPREDRHKVCRWRRVCAVWKRGCE